MGMLKECILLTAKNRELRTDVMLTDNYTKFSKECCEIVQKLLFFFHVHRHFMKLTQHVLTF
jgi:hypothetical protein